MGQEPDGLQDLDDEARAIEALDRIVPSPSIRQAEERPDVLRRLRAEVLCLHVVGCHVDDVRLNAPSGPVGEELPEVVVAGRLAEDHEDIEGEGQDLERMHRRDDQEIDPRAGDTSDGREDACSDALELQGFLDDLGDERGDPAADKGQDGSHDVRVDLDRDRRGIILAHGQGRRCGIGRAGEGGREEKDEDRESGQKTRETCFHNDLLRHGCLSGS